MYIRNLHQKKLLMMKVSDRGRNVILGKLIWLWFDELLL